MKNKYNSDTIIEDDNTLKSKSLGRLNEGDSFSNENKRGGSKHENNSKYIKQQSNIAHSNTIVTNSEYGSERAGST